MDSVNKSKKSPAIDGPASKKLKPNDTSSEASTSATASKCGQGLKDNRHGGEFQKLILMKVLWEICEFGCKDFSLKSEVSEAGVFDDLVLRYRGEDGRQKVRLMQIKYTESDKSKVLSSENDLIANSTSNYYLPKYFKSFPKIRRNPGALFQDNDDSKYDIEECTIITNLNITRELGRNFDEDRNPDFLLETDSVGSGSKSEIGKKFWVKHQNRPNLSKHFITTTDFNVLIDTLATKIYNKVRLDKTEIILKEYCTSLMKEVFQSDGPKNVKFAETFLQKVLNELDSTPKSFGVELMQKLALLQQKDHEPSAAKRRKKDEGSAEDEISNDEIKTTIDDFKETKISVSTTLSKTNIESDTNYKRLPEPVDRDLEFSDNVENFFDKFRLSAGYPNREQINKLLKSKIEKKFRVVNGEQILNHFSSRIGDWLTDRKAGEFNYEETNRLMNELKEIMDKDKKVNEDYIDTIPKGYKNYRFDCNDTCKEIVEFLAKDEKILLLRCDSIKLGRIQFFQAFEQLQESPKSDELSNFVYLGGHRFVNDITKLRENVTSQNLLIIEWPTNPKLDDVKPIIVDCLNGESKIILIVYDEQTEIENYLNAALKEKPTEFKMTIDFDHLSFPESETVSLQGSEINIKHLLSTNRGDFAKGEILADLISGSLTIGNAIPVPKEFDDYIDRLLFHKNIKENIKENEMLKSKEKVIIVSDVPGMGKSMMLASLSKKLKANSPNNWIIRVDLTNFTTLLNQKSDESKKKLSKQKLKNAEEAISLLCRTLRSETQQQLRNQFDEDLFKSIAEKPKAEKTDNNDIRIVLFFDAFDEFCPDYKDVALSLLEKLKLTSIEKIFITTRSSMQERLEAALGTISYTLKGFTLADQRSFLRKFWLKRLTDEDEAKDVSDPSRIEQKTDEYLDKLLTKISEKPKLDIGCDTGASFQIESSHIPLHLRLIADVYYEAPSETNWQGCFNYVLQQLPNTQPILPDRMGISELYGRFIYKKFEWTRRDKSSTNNEAPCAIEDKKILLRNFFEKHWRIALRSIFSEPDLNALASSPQMKKFVRIRNVRKLFDSLYGSHGLLGRLNDDDGIPHFIHRTFAEYFIADFVVMQLFKKRPGSIFHRFLIHKILFFEEYGSVRKFLDGLLKNGPTIMQQWCCGRDGNDDEEDESESDIEETENNGEVEQIRSSRKIRMQNVQNFGTAMNEIWCEELVGGHRPKDLIATREEPLDAFLCVIYDEMHIEIDRLIFGSLKGKKALRGPTGIVDGIVRRILASTDEPRPEHLQIIQLLTEEGGIDINETGYYHNALTGAAFSNKRELIRLLLEAGNTNGINVNYQLNDGNTALHIAAEKDHLAIAEFLLNHKADPNAKNKNEELTALHIAASKGYLKLFELLIKNNAKIDIQDGVGYTPLHYAAFRGQKVIFNWFFQSSGYDNGKIATILQCKATDNASALHLATNSGDLELCTQLINRGMSLDTKDSLENDVLHRCIFYKNIELCMKLIRNRKSTKEFDEITNEYKFVTKYAEKTNDRKLLQLLLKTLPFDLRKGDGPLHFFAKRGNLRICQWLITLKDLPQISLDETRNWKENNVDIPFYRRIPFSSSQIYKMLNHDRNITGDILNNIQHRAKNGATALHMATLSGNLALCQLLHDQGLPLNAILDSGNTVFHLAASRSFEICDWLLSYSQNDSNLLNARNQKGQTALHLAANSENDEIVKLFLTNSDINAIDKNGWNVVHYAANNKNSKVFLNLVDSIDRCHFLSKTCDGSTSLHIAAKSGNAEICRILIDEFHLNVNDRNNIEETPVHVASNIKTLEILITKIAGDVNLKDKNNRTVLHHVVSQASWDMFLWLWEKQPAGEKFSANEIFSLLYESMRTSNFKVLCSLATHFNVRLDVVDDNGNTLLHQAVLCGRLLSCKWFIRRGIDVNARNTAGLTALHLAITRMNAASIRFLVGYLDIGVEDENGYNALHLAVLTNHLDFYKIMLASVEDEQKKNMLLRAQDRNGFTPVDHIHLSIVFDLLQHSS